MGLKEDQEKGRKLSTSRKGTTSAVKESQDKYAPINLRGDQRKGKEIPTRSFEGKSAVMGTKGKETPMDLTEDEKKGEEHSRSEYNERLAEAKMKGKPFTNILKSSHAPMQGEDNETSKDLPEYQEDEQSFRNSTKGMSDSEIRSEKKLPTSRIEGKIDIVEEGNKIMGSEHDLQTPLKTSNTNNNITVNAMSFHAPLIEPVIKDAKLETRREAKEMILAYRQNVKTYNISHGTKETARPVIYYLGRKLGRNLIECMLLPGVLYNPESVAQQCAVELFYMEHKDPEGSRVQEFRARMAQTTMQMSNSSPFDRTLNYLATVAQCIRETGVCMVEKVLVGLMLAGVRPHRLKTRIQTLMQTGTAGERRAYRSRTAFEEILRTEAKKEHEAQLYLHGPDTIYEQRGKQITNMNSIPNRTQFSNDPKDYKEHAQDGHRARTPWPTNAARRLQPRRRYDNPQGKIICHQCGKPGHIAAHCQPRGETNQDRGRGLPPGKPRSSRGGQQHKPYNKRGGARAAKTGVAKPSMVAKSMTLNGQRNNDDWPRDQLNDDSLSTDSNMPELFTASDSDSNESVYSYESYDSDYTVTDNDGHSGRADDTDDAAAQRLQA